MSDHGFREKNVAINKDYLSLVMRKPDFCICENKDADKLHGHPEADQRLCFRYKDTTIQSLYFLNPKFQASSHLLWLYSPVCVGPGWKPRSLVFSQRGSFGFFDILCRLSQNEKISESENFRIRKFQNQKSTKFYAKNQ